jgi:hypothetical protein
MIRNRPSVYDAASTVPNPDTKPEPRDSCKTAGATIVLVIGGHHACDLTPSW